MTICINPSPKKLDPHTTFTPNTNPTIASSIYLSTRYHKSALEYFRQIYLVAYRPWLQLQDRADLFVYVQVGAVRNLDFRLLL